MNAEQVQTAAWASTMETTSTAVLGWMINRYNTTHEPRIQSLILVFGTVWVLCTAFCAGIVWTAGRRIMEKPPTRPQDTPGPMPGPIQPRPPEPPRRTEVTLIDMQPVTDVTQEIPVVWTPPVSATARR